MDEVRRQELVRLATKAYEADCLMDEDPNNGKSLIHYNEMIKYVTLLKKEGYIETFKELRKRFFEN